MKFRIGSWPLELGLAEQLKLTVTGGWDGVTLSCNKGFMDVDIPILGTDRLQKFLAGIERNSEGGTTGVVLHIDEGIAAGMKFIFAASQVAYLRSQILEYLSTAKLLVRENRSDRPSSGV